MAIEWKLEDNNLAIFQVNGRLDKNEYQNMQTEMEAIIQKVGEVRILVVLDDFLGWEDIEGWEDTTVVERIDTHLKKFAIVGDEKWRDLVALFTFKDFRSVPIEYFEASQQQMARDWLNSE